MDACTTTAAAAAAAASASKQPLLDSTPTSLLVPCSCCADAV